MSSSTILEPKATASPIRSIRSRYQVVATLASSTSGTVLRAWDCELREPVVLKVLSPLVADHARTVERLKAEIRNARRVRHPNVAKVFDLEEWDGRLCITMEYIEGMTIEARLKQGPMPFTEAIPILRTLAMALQAAHELGVVHRDIKPANVMLDAASRPYLLDFGIAVGPDDHDLEEPSIVRGSPAYMAPERWRGAAGLPASDLYSLGVIAFEMLSGRPPFNAGSMQVLMGLHLHAPVPPIERLAPEVPGALATLIARLLKKRPEARPGCAEVAQILRSLMPASSRTTLRGSVLIVEDEPAVRLALAEFFSRRGLTVTQARNGLEGVRLAHEVLPDIIFLDVAMPGVDGVEALRALKEDERTAGRPVVMLSGSLDPQHPVLARGLGAVAFLNKPLNTDVLDLVLDKYLE